MSLLLALQQMDELDFRLQRSEDGSFLETIFAARHWDEFDIPGWSNEQRYALIRSQFTIQMRQYEAICPQDNRFIIESCGTPVGQLMLSFRGGDLQIVNIGLLPEWQGKGYGSAILKRLQEFVRTRYPMRLTLHVDQRNPALRLYKRFSFQVVESRPPYLEMVWTAIGAALDYEPIHSS